LKQYLPGINRICRKLDNDAGWHKLAGCDAANAAIRLERDVASVIEMKPFQIPGHGRGDRAFQPGLACCDLATLYFFSVALACYDRRQREPLFWINVDPNRGTSVLQVLATNLSNALLGVRILALAGLAAEARLALRGFVETADLVVAVAFDREFYFRYIEAEKNPDKTAKYWRMYLSPARCREILSRLDSKLGADAVLQESMYFWRNDIYKWLSRFAHVDPVAHLINAHGFRYDSYDIYVPALGGVRDGRILRTVAKAAIYAALTVRRLGELLCNTDHGWHALELKGDRDRSWITYQWEVLNRYYLHQFSRLAEASGDFNSDDSAPVA
jgi:hypothetical protein